VLAQYLKGSPQMARVVTIDAHERNSEELSLHAYSDSDSAGCKSSRYEFIRRRMSRYGQSSQGFAAPYNLRA
jgi:hypothetical protein